MVLPVLAVLVAGLCGTAGCDSQKAQRRELASGNALDRARGVVAVSRGRDAVAVQKLVDLLEDPDQAVRMYSILALQRLCGRDYGFRYYASDSLRAAAVDRWREALRAGEVELLPCTPQAADGVGRASGPPDQAAGGAAP